MRKVRRVAGPSSQPHLSRRIRCTRWPDEGPESALEMAYSDDDGSHSKGHDRSSRCSRTLQRPYDRLTSEQLAALVTGHAPCTVYAPGGTLHTGGSANLRQCDHHGDSTVLLWPPTDVPEPAGQQGCRMYPRHCYRLQADPIRGCELDQIARCGAQSCKFQ